MSSAPSSRPRVLVVDDEPDDLAIARRELGPAFDVDALGSAAEGLARLRGPVRYDLVIVDYRLGDGNALAFLREACKGESAPPVIVVSGRNDARVAVAARELGAYAFLSKDSFGGGALAALANAALGSEVQGGGTALVRKLDERASLSQVLSRMSEGLYAVDEDGVIVLANRAFERLLGYGPRELLGIGVETVMGIDALGATAGCLARGEAFVETELRAREGEAVPVLVSPTPLLDPGGHVAVVRDFRDIRDRIGSLEKANRKLRDKLVEVAVQVLHNVGNAVASLDVRVEDLARELEHDAEAIRVIDRVIDALAHPDETRRAELRALAKDAAKVLEEARLAREAAVVGIRRGIDHIARAVDHARSFAGKTRAIEEPRLDLPRTIEAARALADDIARGKGIAVEIACDGPSELPLLAVPEAGFEQLLLNLLKNAIESVGARAARDPEAPRRVRIAARTEGEQLVVEVADTGQGFAPDVAARAFEFGYTTKSGGSGFGLHASAEFVERLGGRISIDSPGPDRGATVRVEVPLVLASEARRRGGMAA